MDKPKRYNERYNVSTFQEVDAFIKTCDKSQRDRSLSNETNERIRVALEQETLFDALQIEHTELEIQLQQRKRSTSSPSISKSNSTQSSPVLKPLTGSILARTVTETRASPIIKPMTTMTPMTNVSPTASTCPVCSLVCESETVVTWKECGHYISTVPVLSLTGTKLPRI